MSCWNLSRSGNQKDPGTLYNMATLLVILTNVTLLKGRAQVAFSAITAPGDHVKENFKLED
jgi:hypothetical protein